MEKALPSAMLMGTEPQLIALMSQWPVMIALFANPETLACCNPYTYQVSLPLPNALLPCAAMAGHFFAKLS